MGLSLAFCKLTRLEGLVVIEAGGIGERLSVAGPANAMLPCALLVDKAVFALDGDTKTPVSFCTDFMLRVNFRRLLGLASV